MNNNKNIYLCSFATNDLSLSKKRFNLQSRFFYHENNIKIYSLENIPKNLRIILQKNLKNENRAYGYGIWKPIIVLDFFNKIPENSIMQYSDIGCHFNFKGVKRFKEYIKITNKKGSLVFEYDGKVVNNKFKKLNYQKYFEYQYSKKDLTDFFNLKKNSKILNTPQIWSGTFFLKKNKINKKLLINWLNIMKKNKLIDGSLSKQTEHVKFIENRWDQSVFSILAKKNSLNKISVSECEWAENKFTRVWEHLEKYPILAKRDLKRNFFLRFLNRQKRKYRRFKLSVIKWRNA